MKRMETVDDEFTDACIDFIRRQHESGTPFFVWMKSYGRNGCGRSPGMCRTQTACTTWRAMFGTGPQLGQVGGISGAVPQREQHSRSGRVGQGVAEPGQ